MEPDDPAFIARQDGLTRIESFREFALSDGLSFSGCCDPCTDGLFRGFSGFGLSRHCKSILLGPRTYLTREIPIQYVYGASESHKKPLDRFFGGVLFRAKSIGPAS